MKKVINYGFIPDRIHDEDWVFGSKNLPSYATSEVLQKDSNWEKFLPSEESQNKFGVETFACVTFATLNICEILIKRKYGLDVNFSDRWLAWASETTPVGNSPHKVAETLRKKGVPDEEVWDFHEKVNSFEEYHKQPPADLDNLAKQFLKAWDFKHYFVPTEKEAMKDALKFSPLGMSVTAWIKEGGVYVERGTDNHFTTNYKIGTYRHAFDSYDSHKKKYDGTPAIVKGYYIGKPKLSWPESWFPNLCNA